jgi:signal transduction histidine kinase/DNA-binding response OmpR family regulator
VSADKSNILVVDDLPEKLLVLETILDDLGQNIVTALSGEEALRRVLEYDFAVILLDVKMPGMDGLETAAMIRRRKKSAHVPIIFITAFNDEVHAHQGYSLGAVDYIFSPVVPEILRSKVKVFVDLYRMTQQVRHQADERVALAREQAARAAAEEANQRSNFLAEASKVLSGSLDYEATLRGLLRLSVPYLADLAAITLADEQGQMRPTELAWVDASNRPQRRAVAAAEELHPDLATALRRVLGKGVSECLPEPEDRGQRTVDTAKGTEVGHKLSSVLCPLSSGNEPSPDFALRAVVITPLVARGRVLGALSLGMGPSGRLYSASDRALAGDLAGRAAIAIDNARLYREVQEADRRKNEFLSMLAHELRNPLAPIRNAVQLLRMRGAQDPEINAVRDMIDRQVQQLVRLVDDLLDISRITRGKIRLQTEPLEISTALARAVETTRPLIDSRRHELTVTLPPEPVLVMADPVRLAQVLGNLLNNAAKYTQEGGKIWLTVTREGSEVVLRVRDNGIGIPPDMLSSVFELFTQVENSLDRSQGGLGIGLTLVRRLVEMHGGRVQVYSAGPNQGSEFTVRLPVLAEDHGHRSVVNGVVDGAAGARCKILVVDDNFDAAESLALLLRVEGHDVQVSHDGAEALATVATFYPHVVLLDIGLPGMDGYEVARRLRGHPATESALLVALTGYGQEDDVRRSREAGIDHHFVKPADLAALTTLFASLRAVT